MRGGAALVAAALALAAADTWSAEIELPPVILSGQEVTLQLVGEVEPQAAVAVSATYNPRSRVARTEELGLIGADGSLLWLPERAGLVRLEARPAGAGPEGAVVATRDVGVRFGRPPRSGLATLAIAAAALGCGLLAGLRRSRAPAWPL